MARVAVESRPPVARENRAVGAPVADYDPLVTDAELLAWCVVANVVAERGYGPGGREIRRGIKNFAPGARVWVPPERWGDGGERVRAVGRHRGSGRLVMVVVDRLDLLNFRGRGVYSPALFHELTRDRDDPAMTGDLWHSEQDAEAVARYWNSQHRVLAGVSRPLLRQELMEKLSYVSSATDPATPHSVRVLDWAANLLLAKFGDPADQVGVSLRDQSEADAVAHACAVLRAVVATGPDFHLRTEWPSVAGAARAARELLTR